MTTKSFIARERETVVRLSDIREAVDVLRLISPAFYVQLGCTTLSLLFGANFKLQCFPTFFVIKLKYYLSEYCIWQLFGKYCMEVLLWDELTF